jgi:hypothetical protein
MKDFISAKERLSFNVVSMHRKDVIVFIEWTLLMFVIGMIGGMYV